MKNIAAICNICSERLSIGGVNPDHQQNCVLFSGHAGNLYNEHKLNAELLCLKCNSTIMNSLEQLVILVLVCFIAGSYIGYRNIS